ncbi:MAG: hypothetical protein CSB01_04065 [Bacteroidia bacterium]|nr:MAG: hypothetical protein CSB01_04065 [Bacteroidia bacterium]
MNSFFSFKRFARLLRYDIATNYKFYGLFMGGITLFLSAILTFSMFRSVRSGEYYHIEYIPWFFLFVIGVGVIGIATAFPATKNKVSLAGYLMLPASIFEKYLVQFIIRVVLLVPILFFIFWATAQINREIVLLIYDGQIEQFDAFNYSSFYQEVLESIFDVKGLWYLLIIGIVSIIGFLFCMATFFNRYKVFKVMIAYSVVGFLFLLSLSIFSHLFFPEETKYFLDVRIHTYFITKEWVNVAIFSAVLFTGLPFLLYPIGYFKLKEKEV